MFTCLRQVTLVTPIIYDDFLCVILCFTAKFFGLKRSPPPYMFLLTLNPHHFRKHLLEGANFASAGAGLLDLTGPKGVRILTFFDFHKNLANNHN